MSVRNARLIEVIEVITTRGNGKNEVFREVIQYWSKDGVLLAEKDDFKEVYKNEN
jgi:hypothetical protein